MPRLMNKSFISKGMHATVRRLSDGERKLFPDADVVRESRTTDEFWAERNFYRHRLVQLLWPDLFIHAVGANKAALPKPIVDNDLISQSEVAVPYVTRLFSKYASVPDDHSIFSAHVNNLEKLSLCGCDVCVRHRKFHGQHDLQFRAHEKSVEFEDTGVMLPWRDPTDYCQSEKGIVFFEIDMIFREKLAAIFDTLDLADDEKSRARALLRRIEALTKASCMGMLHGEGNPEMMPT